MVANASSAGETLCQLYQVEPGTFDEMCRADGTLRDHWEYFIRSLQSLGRLELESRRKEAFRLLRENGVTYNVYGDPQGLHRPWQLDPIPLLIDSEEWSQIESGLIQRAELLNLVLADLYGRRELIRKGLLPLELVYTHGGFQRPCDQVRLIGSHQLVLYAADLARAPNGQMWVLGDRTQAPSGAGYALENRTVMARILPSLFRDSHVHRLALFFRALRTSLAAICPNPDTDSRVVVLTPGSRTETYFEHAYLASYLGYTLVQGSDLMVREGQVWLKSLDGLQRVDVVLRRVDDHYCDPLELRQDSQLGVPGLLHAARQGSVAVANPLGSSVLENPAFMAFLPGIAKHLLGQPLRLPPVATWWCGQDKEREYVLANLDKLVIKPTYRQAGNGSVLGFRLSKSELEQWRERIRAQPHLYVGQECVALATTPALVDGKLEARSSVLRAFLTARDDSYVVMPGGLTRIATQKDAFLVSNQVGSVSKDTWVLASEPEKQVTLWLAPQQGVLASATRGYLPSRTAESLFWVGRYAERAEQGIRLLRNVLLRFNQYLEWGDHNDAQCLHTLLRALTEITGTVPGFTEPGAADRLQDPHQELIAIIVDEQRPGSLCANLRSLVHAAHGVRDMLSPDTWRVINDIEQELTTLREEAPGDLAAAQDELDQLITALIAFAGLVNENLTRGQGWHFLDSGRRLERGSLLAILIRETLVQVQGGSVENLVLESVLSTADSAMTYRRRYRSRLELATVLDLVLLDDTNPRSLRYQLDRLAEHIGKLPREHRAHELKLEERLILEVASRVRLSDTVELAGSGLGSESRVALEALMKEVLCILHKLSDALRDAYFSHVEGPRQLVHTQPDYEL